VNGVVTYNVYDGWDLIAQYDSGGNYTGAYLYGAGGGLIADLGSNWHLKGWATSTVRAMQ